MSDRFPICHEITAKWEGRWSDHKAGPGGKTMYGITEAVYQAWLKGCGLKVKPVRNISLSEAKLIYREQYWRPTAETFDLYPGVDLAVYDVAVNSSVSRSIKWLKPSAGSNDHSVIVKPICRARLSFMQSLKIWKTFGKGWGRRVANIEAKGVVMAVTAMGASGAAVKTIVEDSKARRRSRSRPATRSRKQPERALLPLVALRRPSTHPTLDSSTMWLLGALCAALVIIAAVAIAKKKQAKAREEAYAQVLA
ncbi:secretion activator protein [Rhizobium sp. TH135]|uniref:glycosyl hydrolase 108 family protein n=1 Tax=Rhizobium sp. TH135 TaxID=2067451 RepID=UPI000C7CDA31|nr:glycosyl hydrolase 108 family protein [Rhizobium sp. TH135]PLK69876.1 secretion activator protein [Rhizobium sp. TH135]